jgi:hypothetical protein
MQVLRSAVKSLNISSYTERFFGGFPDKETMQKDHDNFDSQRGVEVFLNTCPVWHGGFPLSTTKE